MFEVVVADPFPTYDGSFETSFWAAARRALTWGGALVSTSDPSHKPLGYSAAAATALCRLGFDVVSRQPSSAHYETFEFDLTAWERALLEIFGSVSRISHTKTTFLARASRPSVLRPIADAHRLRQWSETWGSGYLATQSPSDEFEVLLSRGPHGTSADFGRQVRRAGFAVAQLLTMDAHRTAVDDAVDFCAACGAPLSHLDIEVLRGLDQDQGYGLADPGAVLPSVIRESICGGDTLLANPRKGDRDRPIAFVGAVALDVIMRAKDAIRIHFGGSLVNTACVVARLRDGAHLLTPRTYHLNDWVAFALARNHVSVADSGKAETLPVFTAVVTEEGEVQQEEFRDNGIFGCFNEDLIRSHLRRIQPSLIIACTDLNLAPCDASETRPTIERFRFGLRCCQLSAMTSGS